MLSRIRSTLGGRRIEEATPAADDAPSGMWAACGHAIIVARKLIVGCMPRFQLGDFATSADLLGVVFGEFARSIDPRLDVCVAPLTSKLPDRYRLETATFRVDGAKIEIGLDPGLLTAIQAETILLRLHGVLFLIAYAASRTVGGRLHILCEAADVADLPSIGFSSANPANLLVPDPTFFVTAGYEPFRAEVAARFTPWEARADKAIWRGSTTGWQNEAARGHSGKPYAWLQRLHVADRLRKSAYAERCDVGISDIVQIYDPARVAEVAASGLMRPRVAKIDYVDYRYCLDIDGNSNTWSNFFEAFVLGCCVVKVGSPRNFRQWYYDRLAPWTHYVPVAADLSDLDAAMEWAFGNPEEARAIAGRGRAFVDRTLFDGEIEASAARLAALIEGDSDEKRLFADVAANTQNHLA